jgi:membrane-bound lytic murein transglycosylase B
MRTRLSVKDRIADCGLAAAAKPITIDAVSRFPLLGVSLATLVLLSAVPRRAAGQETAAAPVPLPPPLPSGTAAPLDREAFAAWLVEIRKQAITRGVTADVVSAALGDLQPVEQVLERDRTQAEFTLTLSQYLDRRLSPDAVRMSRRMEKTHAPVLRRIGKKYGVDPRVLLAVWGLESNFGRFTGVRPTIPVLATLAFEGRRGEFFKEQLFDALTIISRGDIELASLRGSWAGAMGQTQFMPSSYLAWAEDFDRDGRRDIWRSMPDVFASIANYLRGHGWTPGLWGYAVRVPDAATPRVDTVPLREVGCRAARALTQARSLRDWSTLGVVRRDGVRLPASARAASLLRIEDRAYLVTENYEALLAYNCAHTYALSIALLADRLAPP